MSDLRFFPEENFFEEKVANSCDLQLSIVIPTVASSQFLDSTIESLLSQKYTSWEALFIDAHSKDRTVDTIRSYKDTRIRLQTMPNCRLFEMINRGLSMAQGEYVLILFPGDVLMHRHVLSMLCQNVEKEAFPDLYITASVVRGEDFTPYFIFRPLTKENTKRGIQPCSIQSALIKKSLFKKIGLFDGELNNRAAFDFFCRCAQNESLSIVMQERVFVVQNQVLPSLKFYFVNFVETLRILKKYFGFAYAIRWIFYQKDLTRLLKKFGTKVKRSFQES